MIEDQVILTAVGSSSWPLNTGKSAISHIIYNSCFPAVIVQLNEAVALTATWKLFLSPALTKGLLILLKECVLAEVKNEKKIIFCLVTLKSMS